jgi:hypothetical protein
MTKLAPPPRLPTAQGKLPRHDSVAAQSPRPKPYIGTDFDREYRHSAPPRRLYDSEVEFLKTVGALT